MAHLLSTVKKTSIYTILLLAFLFVLPTSSIGQSNPLRGVWLNFPCGFSDCSVLGAISHGQQQCAVALTSNDCDLFNNPNQAYYGVLSFAAQPGAQGTGTGLYAGFSVNCISPAVHTSAGSVLVLQYANYSEITYHNVSNFKTIGQAIYIDNTTGWPCPGVLNNDGYDGQLPSFFQNTTIQAFELRVVGICSCGNGSPLNGGNPIINDVSVTVFQKTQLVMNYRVFSATTTIFRFVAYQNVPALQTTTVVVNWMATNQTGATCGVLDSCVQSGTSSSCIITVGSTSCPFVTVTFPHAFVGTPTVMVASGNFALSTVVLPTGNIPLFHTQL